MSAPAYEIVTVADMAKIPADRWDAFLVDLTLVVAGIRATNEALGINCLDDGGLTWTDDGESAGEIRLDGPDGERLCTIELER